MTKKQIGIIILIIIVVALALMLFLKSPSEKVNGSLEEIMAKVYHGISEDNLPMALGNVEITSENVESFIGTVDVQYKEAIASESMIGSIAHSVVLIRLEDERNAEETIQTIKENVNPRKWICVEASNVIVKNKGDLVILIMSSDELAPKLEANFDNL